MFDGYIAEMITGMDFKQAAQALIELFWNSLVNIAMTYVEMLNKIN